MSTETTTPETMTEEQRAEQATQMLASYLQYLQSTYNVNIVPGRFELRCVPNFIEPIQPQENQEVTETE
jgi:hypothetical protein